MLKFIEIENQQKLGEIYDGSFPYVHWVGNGLSTSLIYTRKICFISDQPSLRCYLDSDSIFHLLDLTTYDPAEINKLQDEIIHDFTYKNIKHLYNTSRIFRGYKWHEYYLYCIYIAASTTTAGEWREVLHIGEDTFIIGADFYQENEPLYVNLSNFGIDIPEAIQKAILETDVHEDYIDNITINRKWKELMSNYWDVVANKGSYKSLVNSLKWFEWGDLVRLREVWRRNCDDKFEERDLSPIIKDQFKKTYQFYSKTSHIALYAARQQMISGQWDDEYNPEIDWISSIWSWEELALKMCLLGNFYETYFMPIHLDLIRATLEDVVFTTTIKQINSTHLDREDVISCTRTFDCNVRNGDTFVLENVTCQAGPQTLFAIQYDNQSWDSVRICGVEPCIEHPISNNNEYKTFAINKFGGIGSIVHFACNLELDENDFVTKELISWQPGSQDSWKTICSNNIYKEPNIEFNILFQEAREYDLRIQFITALGQTYTRRVVLNIVDVDGCAIGVYKIKRIPYENGIIPDSAWVNNITPDYVFARQNIKFNDNYSPIRQYIPVLPETEDRDNWEGLSLNHCLIIVINNQSSIPTYVKNNYFTHIKTVNKTIYLIGVSKTFWFEPDQSILDRYNVYRSEYIYVPQFHILEELGSQNPLDPRAYEVSQYDSLVFVPQFIYGKSIQSWEWAIKNATKNPHDNWVEIGSIRNLIAADTDKSPLPEGYYDILFKFVFSDAKQHIIKLDSAFRRHDGSN